MELKGKPYDNVFADNLAYTTALYNTPEYVEKCEIETKENIRAGADPGFVDLNNGNYNLKPSSYVYTENPDFKPVPFDKMGRNK